MFINQIVITLHNLARRSALQEFINREGMRTRPRLIALFILPQHLHVICSSGLLIAFPNTLSDAPVCGVASIDMIVMLNEAIVN